LATFTAFTASRQGWESLGRLPCGFAAPAVAAVARGFLDVLTVHALLFGQDADEEMLDFL